MVCLAGSGAMGSGGQWMWYIRCKGEGIPEMCTCYVCICVCAMYVRVVCMCGARLTGSVHLVSMGTDKLGVEQSNWLSTCSEIS